MAQEPPVEGMIAASAEAAEAAERLRCCARRRRTDATGLVILSRCQGVAGNDRETGGKPLNANHRSHSGFRSTRVQRGPKLPQRRNGVLGILDGIGISIAETASLNWTVSKCISAADITERRRKRNLNRPAAAPVPSTKTASAKTCTACAGRGREYARPGVFAPHCRVCRGTGKS